MKKSMIALALAGLASFSMAGTALAGSTSSGPGIATYVESKADSLSATTVIGMDKLGAISTKTGLMTTALHEPQSGYASVAANADSTTLTVARADKPDLLAYAKDHPAAKARSST